MDRFDGRVLIVTGGTGGIGRATSLRLAAEGANVIAVDIVEPTDDLAFTDRLRQSSGDVTFVLADATSSDQMYRVVRDVIREFGHLDGMMNNAGVNGPIATIDEYPEDEFDRVINVNLKAVWIGMRSVIPQMRVQRAGVILNTASTAGVTAYVGTSAYTAAKHGVVGLTKLAAQELAQDGIRVNCICPASIHTPMMHDTEAKARPGDPMGARRAFEAQIPVGRYGRAEEVAAVAAFLLSEEASYVTGAPYLVDGGLLAGGMGTVTGVGDGAR